MFANLKAKMNQSTKLRRHFLAKSKKSDMRVRPVDVCIESSRKERCSNMDMTKCSNLFWGTMGKSLTKIKENCTFKYKKYIVWFLIIFIIVFSFNIYNLETKQFIQLVTFANIAYSVFE